MNMHLLLCKNNTEVSVRQTEMLLELVSHEYGAYKCFQSVYFYIKPFLIKLVNTNQSGNFITARVNSHYIIDLFVFNMLIC